MAAGLPSYALICPSDDIKPAVSGTPLVYGITVSYVIIIDQQTQSGDAGVVVAIESPAIHQGSGSNVLYADGRVWFSTAEEVAELVRKLQDDGRWPVQVDATPFLVGAKAPPATR